MSVLTGPEIERRISIGDISVDPYDPQWVGSNSLDLHLGEELMVYRREVGERLGIPLDPENLPPLEPIPLFGHFDNRWILIPGRLYLGATKERVACQGLTWSLGLRSSAGRLGIDSLAGIGDDGFDGNITVELTVAEPLLLRPGARLFQLTFSTLVGERRPYAGRYQHSTGIIPSRMAER